ncbi:MAG TPA: hypothetical protein VH814_18460 [Steroidobacteraceae bacterium]
MNAVSAQNFSPLEGRNPEMATTLYEAHEIVSIHRALGGGEFDAAIADRIRRISDGPISYTAEKATSSSNAARNFAFELLVAERLVSGGSKPLFPHYADVGALASNMQLAIQCKRVWSSDEQAIGRNFRNAEKDLKPAKKVGARGIVALDISRALNPDFTIPRLADQAAIRDALVGVLEDFIDDNAQMLRDAKAKTIGLLTRVSMMVEQVEPRSSYMYCQQYALTPVPSVSASERQALDEFGVVLQAAASGDRDRFTLMSNPAPSASMSDPET